MPYKTIKNRLVNEVTLGDGYPLSNNLQALKVGGETSPLEMSKQLPDESDKAKVKVVGDLEVTGSILKQPTYHFINGGAYNTGTSKFYLPLVGYNLEYTTTTNRNEFVSFAPPYSGVVKKVVLRSEAAALTTIVGFHTRPELSENPQTTAAEAITVEMADDDISYEFDFTNLSKFVLGDVIAISVTPEAAVNDLIWTVVLEYRGV